MGAGHAPSAVRWQWQRRQCSCTQKGARSGRRGRDAQDSGLLGHRWCMETGSMGPQGHEESSGERGRGHTFLETFWKTATPEECSGKARHGLGPANLTCYTHVKGHCFTSDVRNMTSKWLKVAPKCHFLPKTPKSQDWNIFWVLSICAVAAPQNGTNRHVDPVPMKIMPPCGSKAFPRNASKKKGGARESAKIVCPRQHPLQTNTWATGLEI